MFLDELTSGLDPQARRLTWDLVKQIRDSGVTVVLVSHFMDEAEEMSHTLQAATSSMWSARHPTEYRPWPGPRPCAPTSC